MFALDRHCSPGVAQSLCALCQRLERVFDAPSIFSKSDRFCVSPADVNIVLSLLGWNRKPCWEKFICCTLGRGNGWSNCWKMALTPQRCWARSMFNKSGRICRSIDRLLGLVSVSYVSELIFYEFYRNRPLTFTFCVFFLQLPCKTIIKHWSTLHFNANSGSPTARGRYARASHLTSFWWPSCRTLKTSAKWRCPKKSPIWWIARLFKLTQVLRWCLADANTDKSVVSLLTTNPQPQGGIRGQFPSQILLCPENF